MDKRSRDLSGPLLWVDSVLHFTTSEAANRAERSCSDVRGYMSSSLPCDDHLVIKLYMMMHGVPTAVFVIFKKTIFVDDMFFLIFAINSPYY